MTHTNALVFLREQHKDLDLLFGRVMSTLNPNTRRLRTLALVDSLALHLDIEAQGLHSAVRCHETKPILTALLHDHIAMRQLASDLTTPGLFSDETVARLKVNFDLHVADEEQRLFPIAGRELNPARLESIGSDMRQAVIRGGPFRNVVSESTLRIAASGRRSRKWNGPCRQILLS